MYKLCVNKGNCHTLFAMHVRRSDYNVNISNVTWSNVTEVNVNMINKNDNINVH